MAEEDGMAERPLTRVPTRLSDREKRRRRLSRLEAMRETVAALEAALPAVRSLDADDEDDDRVLWEELLDAKTLRLRDLMRKTILLTNEAQRLTSAHHKLKRLLREHQVASHVLAGLVAPKTPYDEWKEDVERWEVIVRKHYKPKTMEECNELMEVALKEVSAFQWSTEKQSTGVSLMGWRDSRRVDHARGAFQFQFQKTFYNYDMEDYVNLAWAAYTDSKTFYDVLIGPRAQVVNGLAVGSRLRAVHHELQELGPNTMIVRNVEQYPDGAVDVHMVDMVSRVETERGYIQCVRSICCPELMKALDEPRTVWSSNAIWFVWERLEGEQHGFTMSIGGSLVGNDFTYLTQWMFEGLGCVLRSERIVTGRRLITDGW